MNAFDPRLIEEKSFALIREKLREFPLKDPDEATVIERVIHATADFTYVELLTFSAGAIERGITALKEGCRIVTDVGMVAMGINKRLCRKLGVVVRCYLKRQKSEEVPPYLTRSMWAMYEAIEKEGDQIYVIGNAPTALFALTEALKKGKITPPLIVGVPVGFVGAAEAKALLRTLPFASITTKGPKGGTPVAVAVVNALLTMATGARHG